MVQDEGPFYDWCSPWCTFVWFFFFIIVCNVVRQFNKKVMIQSEFLRRRFPNVLHELWNCSFILISFVSWRWMFSRVTRAGSFFFQTKYFITKTKCVITRYHLLRKLKSLRAISLPSLERVRKSDSYKNQSFENMVSDLKILSPMWYQQDHESFNPSVKHLKGVY